VRGAGTCDGGAFPTIVIVRRADSFARIVLDGDAMAAMAKLAYGRRRESDAVFRHLYFLRNADVHGVRFVDARRHRLRRRRSDR
jgi:hypothetical protein